MASLGLSVVRIGEFAWSRLEPARGGYQLDWLARAVDTLAENGLKVVLGTPTATPPKWLVDEMPGMLPVGSNGQVRGFGSRRHYCFSHLGYRAECERIVTQLARRFGEHPAVTAWQIDNEYGCHDTALSWSNAARDGFRDWLAQKYQSTEALNRAWGNVFWSMEYRSFDEIELPASAVTEVNPAHMMDFRRYSARQVADFNRLQADILRSHSPGRDIIHNFMGRTLSFDHFALGRDIDVASWDSYPLGFLEDRSDASDERRKKYLRAGDPDFQAFHHDLYRAVGNGRWWVMEQQPGPVNWAQHNPAPRDGMIRLWTWEAIAHGAEAVSYFRWRQAPFAQEQMHSGLLMPDGGKAPGFAEADRVAGEIAALGELPQTGTADVAIVFDYPSAWAWEIQPHGREFDYFRLVFDFYRGLRKLGLSVDFVSAEKPDIGGYRLVLVPGLFAWNDELLAALESHAGIVVTGPRSGSKTLDFRIPDALPPSLPTNILDLRVLRVESLRDGCPVAVPGQGAFKFWFEHAVTGALAKASAVCENGMPAIVRQKDFVYLCGWPDDQVIDSMLRSFAGELDLEICPMSGGVRMRERGDLTFLFNYGDVTAGIGEIAKQADGGGCELLLGDRRLEPSGISIIRRRKRTPPG